MKKILISIPFIVLVVLNALILLENTEEIFGALGVLQHSFTNPATELFGNFFFCIGPLILITYAYSKLAAKFQVNVSRAGSWTLLVVGVFSSLAHIPSPFLEPYFPEQFRTGRFIISIVFAGLGLIGLINSRSRSNGLPNEQDGTTTDDSILEILK